jgi:hypothetical protein
MDHFQFQGLNQCDSVCGIEVYDKGQYAAVVVVSELDENPGTSVTNAWPFLADEISKDYNLGGQNIVWIEYYPANKIRGEVWDRVHLELANGEFQMSQNRHPWQSLTKEQVQELIWS